MTTKPTIAFVVCYGPEVRAFLHSSLVVQLQQFFRVQVFARRPLAGEPIDHQPFPCESAQPRLLASLARRSRSLHRRAIRYWQGPAPWRKAFESQNVTAIVVASFSGAYVLPVLAAARALKIHRYVLLNSWKDGFTKPHIPIDLTAVGAVEPALTQVLARANRHFDPKRTFVIGSLHLAALRRAKRCSREGFCLTHGLDPNRPFWCYSATKSSAHEDYVVARLAKELAIQGSQLLVRLNPQDTTNRFDAATRISVQRPRWTFDAAADWNQPLAADAALWRGTIEHASGNFSAPSTVTAEFAAFGKPVINLRFLANGLDDEITRVYRRSLGRCALDAGSVAEAVEATKAIRGRNKPFPDKPAVKPIVARLIADLDQAASTPAQRTMQLEPPDHSNESPLRL